jgi:hypothetical protein
MRGWPADLGGGGDEAVVAVTSLVGDKMADYSWVPPGLPSARLDIWNNLP